MADNPTNEQPPRNLPTITPGGEIRAIIPQSIDEVWRIANAMVRSGLTPRGLEKPEACMIAIMHGMEVGLPPMAAVQSIAVINGRPTIYGDGAIALVRSSQKLEYFRETMTGEGDDLTAVCTVKRRGDPDEVIGRFSVDDAKTAGLWTKRGKQGELTPWQTYPKRMLRMRARAFALRDGFADVLKGLSIHEEMDDVELMKDVTPLTPPEPPPTPPPAASPEAAQRLQDTPDAAQVWDEPEAPADAPAPAVEPQQVPPQDIPAQEVPPQELDGGGPDDEPFDPETGELGSGPTPSPDYKPGPAEMITPEDDDLIPPMPPILDRRPTGPQLDADAIRDWLEELENAFGGAEGLEDLQEEQRKRMAPMRAKVPAAAWKLAQGKLDQHLLRLRP